ncbi:MAG: hypothetical protein ACFFC7_07880 [Candidatus Hermodarchaeota archaeon]
MQDLQGIINQNLHTLCEKQKLMGAVVFNVDGLVLGSYVSVKAQEQFGNRVDEIIAAMGAVFDDITMRAQEDLEMENINEVAINSKNHKIVFRLFSVENRNFMLGLIVRPYASYRRATTMVIKQIAEAMSG